MVMTSLKYNFYGKDNGGILWQNMYYNKKGVAEEKNYSFGVKVSWHTITKGLVPQACKLLNI
jgi:hypothetical protein